MSGEPFDWRADEVGRLVVATRENIAAHDRAIASLQRDLQIANAAHSEFEADVRALTNQQFELRAAPPVEYRDGDGFEQRGPSPETQREYERLTNAISTREAAYRRWVEARLVTYNDGPIPASWSPRNPIAVQQRIQRLGISRAVLGNQLHEIEAQLSPGQLLATGVEAPDLVEHRQRVAAGRERAGIGG